MHPSSTEGRRPQAMAPSFSPSSTSDTLPRLLANVTKCYLAWPARSTSKPQKRRRLELYFQHRGLHRQVAWTTSSHTLGSTCSRRSPSPLADCWNPSRGRSDLTGGSVDATGVSRTQLSLRREAGPPCCAGCLLPEPQNTRRPRTAAEHHLGKYCVECYVGCCFLPRLC